MAWHWKGDKSLSKLSMMDLFADTYTSLGLNEFVMLNLSRENIKLYMMMSSNGNIFVLLAICAGNSQVPCYFPAQRPVTRSSDVFFDLGLNTRLSEQSQGWWFETPSRPLWRQCNDFPFPSFLLIEIVQVVENLAGRGLGLVYHVDAYSISWLLQVLEYLGFSTRRDNIL